jgi:hypothetical protein
MEPFYTAPEGSLSFRAKGAAPSPERQADAALTEGGREPPRRHPQVGRTGRRRCCALRYRPAKFENAPQRPSLDPVCQLARAP